MEERLYDTLMNQLPFVKGKFNDLPETLKQEWKELAVKVLELVDSTIYTFRDFSRLKKDE